MRNQEKKRDKIKIYNKDQTGMMDKMVYKVKMQEILILNQIIYKILII